MSYEMVKLHSVAQIIAGQSPDSQFYNAKAEGMPFFQGKADFGEQTPTVRYWCTKPTKVAEPNDILFSVRAPVGPTNICDVQACIGRGLAAIRTGKKLDTKFLYFYFKFIEEKIALLGNGSTFAAITINVLKHLSIPLPPLETQKRIADILNAADALRKKDQELLTKYDELAQAIFIDMFGDPVKNEKGLKELPFEEMGLLERGISKHRPRNAPELLGGLYPLIQTGNVANSGGWITNYKSTYSEIGLKQSKLWPKGTLCITIAANIAKTGILTFDACFPDSIVGFTPHKEKSNSVFVMYWIGFLQKILEDNAPESAQKNINLEILRNLKIICPSIEQQDVFAEVIMKLSALKNKVFESGMDNLFDSLIKQAFKGELVV